MTDHPLHPGADVTPDELAHIEGRDIPDTNLPDEFWNAREQLTAIRIAAHRRAIAASGVLGAVLARVSFLTPHNYQLPAIVGGRGSLNVIHAILGKSGEGKSTAVNLAAELIPHRYDAPDLLDDHKVGSGEGLAQAYISLVDEEVEVEGSDGKTSKQKRKVNRQVRHGVYFNVDEGQILTDLSARKGSTLLSELRTAWSGGTLGQGNASAETTRRVPAHNYRCAMVAAFQPATANRMLADAAGGTPQRMAWFSAYDPTIVTEYRGVVNVPALDWTPPVRLSIPHGLDVVDSVGREIFDDHLAVQRREVELGEFDSHRNQVRLKLAALLAILDGRTGILDEDWELAGMITEASSAAVTSIQAAVRTEAADRERASIGRKVREQQVLDGAAERAAIDRMVNAITNKLRRYGPQKRRALNHCAASNDRKLATIDAVLDEAIARRLITLDGDEYHLAA